MTTLVQAPRRSLVEATMDLIRDQIESGSWKVGSRIPKEQELADALRVGRNTVREAIRVLSHANVLEVRQGDGTYVRSNVDPAAVMRRVDRASLREHFELRAMLETEAARLAAMQCSTADVGALRDLLGARGEQNAHPDREAFVDADLAFHSGIAQMSGNAALAELYRFFASKVRLNTLSALGEKDLPEPGRDAHARIVDAIERHDADGAAEAARAVIEPLLAVLANHRVDRQ